MPNEIRETVHLTKCLTAGIMFSWHLGEIKILNVVAELSMAWDKLVTIVLSVSPLSPNVLTSRPETGFY
jgi:hypothetical protein